jgi:hypothetical protein
LQVLQWGCGAASIWETVISDFPSLWLHCRCCNEGLWGRQHEGLCGRCLTLLWLSSYWIVIMLVVLLLLMSLHRLCMLAGSFAGRSGMRRAALMSAGPMAVMLWHE